MRCANPPCHNESSYLRDGSLYRIDELPAEGASPRSRFIWLCRSCAPRFVVETWRPPGEQLRAVRADASKPDARAEAAEQPPRRGPLSHGVPALAPAPHRAHV